MSEPRSSALCIGVSSFGSAGVEGLPGAPRDLPFAGRMARELAELLGGFGYAATCVDDSVSAAEVGATVRKAIAEADPEGTLVVHVLSHGALAPTGLHVVGGDGGFHDSTDVDGWLKMIVNAQGRTATTLFLLDVCHGGDAARPAWLPKVSEIDSRAWVIAACGPEESAFAGRFTEAVTTVLRRLAAGELDIDESREFVPLDTLARHVRRTVNELADARGQLAQRVTASLLDMSAEVPDLRFFRNLQYDGRRRRRFSGEVDAATAPFLDDLDEALDAEHFVRRAAGRANLRTGRLAGCFSGRGRELRILAPWINLHDDVGLRVVTGSPGVGKSALLGILVCATHPRLRPHTRDIWYGVAQSPFPSDLFAAVHARQRTLAQVAASIARQLRLDVSGIEGLLAAVAHLPKPPAIVVDALDEAVDGPAIMRELLLPLAATTCADGRAVRLLVGVRPWPDFAPLREAAGDGLIDLDAVPNDLLRDDVRHYVAGLLTLDRRWDELEVSGATHTLAHAIAHTLTEQPDQQWGAFLVASLYTNHILRTHAEPIKDPAEAASLGRRVPRSLPELLDLDLATRTRLRWMRPVLTATAHALGEGMPAESIRHVAAALAGEAAPEPGEILTALDEASFYLRHSADVDGTTRYRLFHQGLADHLRDPDEAGAVFTGLLASLPGRAERYWSLAEPYLLRHMPAHAAAAGRMDELIGDAGFLVEADPATVLPELERAGDAAGPLAEVYRAAREAGLGETREQRARVLAVAAARSGDSRLARALAGVPGRGLAGTGGSWAPVWVAGRHRGSTPRVAADELVGAVAGSLLAFSCDEHGNIHRQGHMLRATDASVVGVAVGEGRLSAYIGARDGQIHLHDLATPAHWVFAPHPGPVTGMSIVDLESGLSLITSDASAVIRVIDARTGDIKPIDIGGDVRGDVVVAAVRAGNQAMAGICAANKARVWDLHSHRPAGQWLVSESDPIVALTAGEYGGRAHVVARTRTGQLSVRELGLGTRPRYVPLGLGPVIRSHASAADIIVTGGADGHVRLGTLASTVRSVVLSRHVGSVPAVACAVVGETVYVVSTSGRSVRLNSWARTDDTIREFPDWDADMEVTTLSLVHVDDRVVAVAGGGSGVMVGQWDVGEGRRTAAIKTVESEAVTAAALASSADRSVAILGTAGGTIELRPVTDDAVAVGPIPAHDDAVLSIQTHEPDGRPAVVSVGRDRTVQFRTVDDGTPLFPPIQVDHEILEMRFGQLGGRAVAALWGADFRGTLWDLPTASRTGALSTGPPPSGAAPAHGVWCDVVSGQPAVIVDGERHPLDGHQAPVVSTAVGAVDGEARVYTGDTGGVVHIWDPRTRQILDTVVVGRPIDQLVGGDDGELLIVNGGEVLALRHHRPPEPPLPAPEPPSRNPLVERYERMVEQLSADQRRASPLPSDATDAQIRSALWYTLVPPAADARAAERMLADEIGACRPGDTAPAGGTG
ncbi:caspase family protein [Phytohabitans houttuyneae]|uniref:Peptidase C14 caspase domain-containing protein n=1 Tax=Phytohabitans houttuyneae TaxID=1076126 RepID=A0A6V8KJT4_9ACTN|nr:caspase family protein [Phytohabitans houttuyneae]GFJ82246.1 hypothetical protein Phou_064260 [Phytohabitans houttuyneae]